MYIGIISNIDLLYLSCYTMLNKSSIYPNKVWVWKEKAYLWEVIHEKENTFVTILPNK